MKQDCLPSANIMENDERNDMLRTCTHSEPSGKWSIRVYNFVGEKGSLVGVPVWQIAANFAIFIYQYKSNETQLLLLC